MKPFSLASLAARVRAQLDAPERLLPQRSPLP
jgi:DNA-binding response OmpR family regulator